MPFNIARKVVPVPFDGVNAFVRVLTGNEMEVFQRLRSAVKDSDPDSGTKAVHTLVMLTLCNEHGELHYQDTTPIGDLPTTFIDKVVDEALVVNGLKQRAVIEAKKDSGPTPI